MPSHFINGSVNISMDNITRIINISDPVEFFINVNHIVYNEYLYFFLLWVLVIILYLTLQTRNDQPIINLMVSTGIASVLSLFYRGILFMYGGVVYSLITDYQMWIFPIMTAIFAIIAIANKER